MRTTRYARLVRMLCFVMLAGASLGAAAQSSSGNRFFQGWFAQGAERPNGRGDNQGGARSGPSRPQPQEVRPQGDLRGDIYNHIREQRQPPPPPPSDSRQRGRGDRGR
ncbi:hypothetical protein PCA31118_00437 [Pandoraea captiosa]|uniref:Peptide-binding protein n=1 Tax=Pandoraea captiosa TaxID=2508302 RepID=A0A5E4ZKX1_9BURK|nr:hypothetical protein [Pandoraea captiosa]VVE61025.1 hypothetical protein PCA31118_00437 [Pandoraea captiosa]